jgi:hypothetical protein
LNVSATPTKSSPPLDAFEKKIETAAHPNALTRTPHTETPEDFHAA